ncbi:diacylglycerol/lipid kinase family protein [Euzebya tangerina]|uniref:diacylglycerol/lipid kinase family protein n=1 Tax=Euzebya tangerina TaxID=591198 RepID=UPI0013C2CC0E|nr:diacylglycerol kinase family protein [Euzebya tangerina]
MGAGVYALVRDSFDKPAATSTPERPRFVSASTVEGRRYDADQTRWTATDSPTLLAPTRPGTTVTRHVGVVVNPERDDLAEEFLAELEGRATVTVERLDDASQLPDAVSRLVAAGVHCVAAVGGDGTQRAAATVLADTPVGLVVVPAGTVNLLGQVLGITTVQDAVTAAFDGEEVSIDLGEAEEETFVLNASSGWDAATIAGVDDGLKRFGRAGFAVAGLREWIRNRALPVRVTVDGHTWHDGHAVAVLVLNVGQRASTDFDVAPEASVEDGRLDVVVLPRHSVVGLMRSMAAIVRGGDATHGDARATQGAEITVQWGTPVAHQVDGDATGLVASVTYRARPGALRVRRPPRRSAVRDPA